MKKFLRFFVVASIFATTLFAFDSRVPNLNNKQIDKFILGLSFFSKPWIPAPTATTARDGLGPLFSSNSCNHCHQNNTGGYVYNQKGEVSREMVPRLSMPGKLSKNSHLGFIPTPHYGAQLSINGTVGVPYEGKLELKYKKIKITFPDKSIVYLRNPHYSIDHLQYGKLAKNYILSVRRGPPLLGVGYIEDISKKDILKNVDVNDKNHDGISGKANYVYDIKAKKFALGLYDYKDYAPTLRQQVATAMHNDMSLNTTYFTKDNCTKIEKACLNAPKPFDAIDAPDFRIDAIAYYIEKLQIPKPAKNIDKKGQKLFTSLKCALCHIPTFKNKKGGFLHPYSDFLLHDMGKALADKRTEYLAKGNEWRTAPLWGMNYRVYKSNTKQVFLHDGRARTIQEAILWHGGEAKKSKENFMHLEKNDRKHLINFVKGL